MYFLFIICISFCIAVFLWMAASDVLALNKRKVEVSLELPETIFMEKEIETFDDNGVSIGTETIHYADIDYISNLLKENGLINYKWLFTLFCKISNAEIKFDPGEYTVKSSYDYRALVQNLREDNSRLRTVDITIPEGYSVHQIFMKLDEEKVASYDELMNVAANNEFNYSFMSDSSIGNASRLEGYLFPDTYQFYLNMDPASAVNRFLETYNIKITEDMKRQSELLNVSFDKIIIIASIIEKEAKFDQDRATVASVIYNRLNSDWQLGLDSTILYMYPDWDDEPTAEMIAKDTEYNTRIHRGLPPTAICNPGIASIQAALNPDQTNYYYFASDEEGFMHFFNSSNEFDEFVQTLN